MYVSWGDAARFANWLNNGQPSGPRRRQHDRRRRVYAQWSGHHAALNGVTRNSGASWFIPSEDEWYKAAYYDGSTYHDYPTGTDTTPDNNLPSADSGNSANFNDGAVHDGRQQLSDDRRGSVYALGQPLRHVRSGWQCVGMERTPINSGSLSGLAGWFVQLRARPPASSYRADNNPTSEVNISGSAWQPSLSQVRQC